MSHASPPAPRASYSDADRAPRGEADQRDPGDPRDAAPDAQRDERVSILCGDRQCVGCAFNLSGQPVVREPHYRMLIVRCPECGTAAALQEYPALGKWAARWAAIAAGLYLLVLLAGMFAAGGAGFGFCMASTDEAADSAGLAIAELQERDGIKPPGYGSPTRSATSWDPIDPAWLAKQDLGALRRRVAPWPTAVIPQAAPFWTSGALVAVCFGVVASVALMGVSRWRLPLTTVAPAALAAFFCWQRWLEITSGGGMRTEANELAERMIGPTVWGMTIALLMIAMGVGLVIGRPVARGMVRALLPPRLAASFSALWTCDGLTLKPGAGKRSRR